MSRYFITALVFVLTATFILAEDIKPIAIVSIPPQAGIARAVAGGTVDFIAIMDESADPHSFDPPRKRIIGIGNSLAYFTAGLPFEETLAIKLKASAPNLLIKNTSDGFTAESQNEYDHDCHEHGDPHTWMSYRGVICIASNIAETLSGILPENASLYKSNFEKIRSTAEAGLNNAKTKFATKSGSTILVYHPAYGYLADELGLSLAAIEKHGGEPPLKHLMEISGLVEENQIKAVIVQNESEAVKIKNFAERHNLKTVMVSPMSVCANGPDGIEVPVCAFLETLGLNAPTSVNNTK